MGPAVDGTKAPSIRRLLYVITSLDYGGAEALVVQLALQFRLRGWRVGVVSMIQPQAYEVDLKAAGVEVFSLGMRRGSPDPRGVTRLAGIYRSFKPDVVHAHMVHANILARLARALMPVPALICTAHNINEGGRHFYYAYQFTDWLSEFTTNVSQNAVERYIELRALRSEKSGYIPNGVDLTRFARDDHARRRLRESLGVGDEFVWLAVGRLTEQKDYPNMLEAVALTQSSSRVLIVGDGELRQEITERAQQLDLDQRVTFLGVRSDVSLLMSAADAYLLSSAWEGLPMVLLEAAATCLPAVATDVGGVSEIVQPGSGLLVASRDAQALADAMLEMESYTEAQRAGMGESARATALNVFDMTKVADRWQALFEEALVNAAGKRTRRASVGRLTVDPVGGVDGGAAPE